MWLMIYLLTMRVVIEAIRHLAHRSGPREFHRQEIDVDRTDIIDGVPGFAIKGEYVHQKRHDYRGDGYRVLKAGTGYLILLVDISLASHTYVKQNVINDARIAQEPTDEIIIGESRIKEDIFKAFEGLIKQTPTIDEKAMLGAIDGVLIKHNHQAGGDRDLGASATAILVDPTSDKLKILTVGTNAVAVATGEDVFKILAQSTQFYCPYKLPQQDGHPASGALQTPIHIEIGKKNVLFVSTDGIKRRERIGDTFTLQVKSGESHLLEGSREGLYLVLEPLGPAS